MGKREGELDGGREEMGSKEKGGKRMLGNLIRKEIDVDEYG